MLRNGIAIFYAVSNHLIITEAANIIVHMGGGKEVVSKPVPKNDSSSACIRCIQSGHDMEIYKPSPSECRRIYYWDSKNNGSLMQREMFLGAENGGLMSECFQHSMPEW